MRRDQINLWCLYVNWYESASVGIRTQNICSRTSITGPTAKSPRIDGNLRFSKDHRYLVVNAERCWYNTLLRLCDFLNRPRRSFIYSPSCYLQVFIFHFAHFLVRKRNKYFFPRVVCFCVVFLNLNQIQKVKKKKLHAMVSHNNLLTIYYDKNYYYCHYNWSYHAF